MSNQCMRIQKQRGDEVIYPISLSFWQEEAYGKDIMYGDKQIAEHEIYICVGGDAVAYVGDNSYTVSGGTVLTYKPEEQHRIYVTGLTSYDRYVLLFHCDELAGLWDGAESALFSMFSRRNMYEKNSIHLLPGDFQKLLFLLERAVGYGAQPSPGNEALFVADFIKIMRLLSDGFAHTQVQQNLSTRVPVVNMALEIIEKNFCEIHQVSEISHRLNVSDSYLARMFKKQVGTSVYEYLLNMKFANAVKLLATGHSVTNACFDSGFNSYSHFIQMFKRRYGMPPRKYQMSLEV